jgi:hypothetical protein
MDEAEVLGQQAQQLSVLIPEVTDMILPWIGILISIVIFLWFKDFATNLAKGLAFKIDPHFQEGNVVFLDDESAVIVKIGITQTIFAIVNGRGCIWRFIPNDGIANVKLEKVISDKIHYDTDEIQSKKLRELLSLTEEQDEMIAENRRKDVAQDEMIAHIESYNHMQDTKMQEHREHLEKMIKDVEGGTSG